MKKIIFSAIVLALVTVSCNQKTKESTTDHSNMMSNDSTMMNDGSSKKMMTEKMYACPMHPEVQGKLNDKCSKCGMKLTVPVLEKKEENK
ncbi:heavy metal-binding domain-containing protein [Flavobacterium sp.]|uniref:heavy metal-binding domain-containing protein n=1 Tax=Flavobacterium sp. TaxID=239 RepID=UPI00375003E5